MPKIDLTVTVSVIIALCAIVTPLLTTMINNNHQIKMKKIELELQEKKELDFYKRSIYENYLKYASRYIYHRNNESAHLYDENYALAIMYFPQELFRLAAQINDYMVSNRVDEARSMFVSLSVNIRKTLGTQ